MSLPIQRTRPTAYAHGSVPTARKSSDAPSNSAFLRNWTISSCCWSSGTAQKEDESRDDDARTRGRDTLELRVARHLVEVQEVVQPLEGEHAAEQDPPDQQGDSTEARVDGHQADTSRSPRSVPNCAVCRSLLCSFIALRHSFSNLYILHLTLL
jgi:hypothetical protein